MAPDLPSERTSSAAVGRGRRLGEPSIRHVTDGLSDGEWTWNIQSKMPLGVGSQAPVFAGWEMCEGSFCRPTLRHAKSPLKAPQGLSGHLGWRCGLSSQGNFCRHTPPHPKSPSKPLRGWPGHLGWRCGHSAPRKFLPSYATAFQGLPRESLSSNNS